MGDIIYFITAFVYLGPMERGYCARKTLFNSVYGGIRAFSSDLLRSPIIIFCFMGRYPFNAVGC